MAVDVPEADLHRLADGRRLCVTRVGIEDVDAAGPAHADLVLEVDPVSGWGRRGGMRAAWSTIWIAWVVERPDLGRSAWVLDVHDPQAAVPVGDVIEHVLRDRIALQRRVMRTVEDGAVIV